jgi:hypothetical protein
MTDLPESQIPVNHHVAALEASCDTLITLQVIRAASVELGAVGGDVESLIKRAIRSQRRAITELRLARSESEEMLILGFVIGADLAT